MNDQFEFGFGDEDPPRRFNFQPPSARPSDPETSHEAAHDAEFHASKGRLLVLFYLNKYGPLTDFELARLTAWQQTSIGKRRHECMEAGLVEVLRNGEDVVKRPAPSGSNARVWKLTDKGREYWNGMD